MCCKIQTSQTGDQPEVQFYFPLQSVLVSARTLKIVELYGLEFNNFIDINRESILCIFVK